MGILEKTGLDFLAGLDAHIDARISMRLAKAGADDWLDQSKSGLGPRRHCALVRRMVAEGDERARIRGRKHLMTRSAAAEHDAALSLPKARTPVNDVAQNEEEASAYQEALRKAMQARK